MLTQKPRRKRVQKRMEKEMRVKSLYFLENARPRHIAQAVALPVETVRAIIARCKYLVKTSERRRVEKLRPGPKGYDRGQVCDLL